MSDKEALEILEKLRLRFDALKLPSGDKLVIMAMLEAWRLGWDRGDDSGFDTGYDEGYGHGFDAGYEEGYDEKLRKRNQA